MKRVKGKDLKAGQKIEFVASGDHEKTTAWVYEDNGKMFLFIEMKTIKFIKAGINDETWYKVIIDVD